MTTLLVVTGAPGAGKTTTVETLLQLEHEFVVLDIDWLIGTASKLAGKDIHFAPETWAPYGELWLDVLGSHVRNGQQPIFFTPTDQAGIKALEVAEWCTGTRACLLDCADEVRRTRLDAREWPASRIEEAMVDIASTIRADERVW